MQFELSGYFDGAKGASNLPEILQYIERAGG